jgi:hypothetical protein
VREHPPRGPRKPLRNEHRDTRGVVRFEGDVKNWPPPVGEARPKRYVACGRGAYEGGRLGIHGHGLVERQLPQAGAEQGLEEESPAFAATVEEPRKERTPRLDCAGLLRRTFALDVFACLRCGGRLKGVGVREGSRRGESDSGAVGVAHGECAPGPCARAAPERGVVKHKPPQPAKRARHLPRPSWEGGWGRRVPQSGCAASPPAWHTAHMSPSAVVLGPPRPLCTSPHPQHSSYLS